MRELFWLELGKINYGDKSYWTLEFGSGWAWVFAVSLLITLFSAALTLIRWLT